MARPLRIEFPGAIYHVTSRMLGSRSDRKTRLFKDQHDFVRFLELLEQRVESYSVRVYLYCLMQNHYHLVLETPEGNLSQFMQSLSTAYTVYYNRRHNRHGHLFDGRYKAKVVEGDEYLNALSRYVHLNPVAISSWKNKELAEKRRHLRNYPWSSYPSYIGKRKKHEYVDYAPILSQMGRQRSDQPECYREFVESGLAQSDEEFKQIRSESVRSVGSPGFNRWVEELYEKRVAEHDRVEDVSYRRMGSSLSSEEVLGVLGDVFDVDEQAFRERRRNSPLRAVVSSYLVRYSGCTQREIAELLGMRTGGAVSAQLRHLPQLLAKDLRLQRLMRSADRKLQRLKRDQQAVNY